MRSQPRRGLLYTLSASLDFGQEGQQTWCVLRSETENRLRQAGLESTAFRLTAEWLVAASHCKHETLDARNLDFAGIWGDSGGTLEDVESGSRKTDSGKTGIYQVDGVSP